MKRSYENEPLLYVSQPELTKPRSSMQFEYMSKADESLEEKKTVKDHLVKSSFKELSIEEKINYLVGLPKDLFQLKCEIKTNEKTYRGIVMRKEDDTVHIYHTGRQVATIAMKDIKHMTLLGL